MKAYLLVTQSEADAYKEMQSQLGFSDDVSILRYIKVKAINGYNQKNLIVGVNPAATTKAKWTVFEKEKKLEVYIQILKIISQ